MNIPDIDFLSKLLHAESGLVINADKAYLFESRLVPVMSKFGIASLEALVADLRQKKDRGLLNSVTEAMTTNETYFFRDTKPFSQFREFILPMMVKNRESRKQLRIWSAAAASGQEAYSLAMICQDFKHSLLRDWQVTIIGTDISSEMIDRARSGIYSQFEVQRGLPINYLTTHFTRIDNQWQISEELRKMVKFETANLKNIPSSLGTFDVIFCRNVLIYFDIQLRTQVLDGVHRLLAPDGAMILGGTETVMGISELFEMYPEDRGVYRPLSRISVKAAG
ncbi:MAG: protein-glutamate O-methyltransferase CheR [Candidatus Pacebacteria bacterium]|nr:protein-glutamate O-methyltransferase CheR [Candidatus Paceibacterota bacterium]